MRGSANAVAPLVLVICLGVSFGGRAVALGGGQLQPNPDSPLAEDGKWLYAVTPSRTALLRRPLQSDAPWQLLEGAQPFVGIAGMAYSPKDDALAVVDVGAQQI